jgi:hypothetical protein
MLKINAMIRQNFASTSAFDLTEAHHGEPHSAKRTDLENEGRVAP